MKLKLDMDRRQTMLAAAIALAVICYFELVVFPNGEAIDSLTAELTSKSGQLTDLKTLKELLADCDKLTAGQSDAPMSIEARVEKVGRELGLHPTISKRLDTSPTDPNKVDVVLGNLYLRELIQFMKKIEAFPVTVQIVRLEISKNQNVANVSLTLSDLNL